MSRYLLPYRRCLQWTVPVLWGLASLWAHHIDPDAYGGGRARDETERIRRNSSALAAMMGEFRTSISDIMFMKTERYLHGGVAYLPHHSESALSAEDLAADAEEHQSELGLPDDDEYDHSGTPTVIPPPDRDFRGWIGALHREVRPWRDPARAHIHTDGRDLLPWFRVMTQIDPRYIRGYVAGGFWLAQADRLQAIDFVAEGLQHNPDAFELYVSRGLLRLRTIREQFGTSEEIPPDERAFWKEARDDFRRGAELARAQRPDDVDEEGFGSGGWGRYHENDALAACRMDIILTQRLDGHAAAAERRALYAQTFPELADFAID